MSSTDNLPSPTAGGAQVDPAGTVLSIPEDVWVMYLLNYLDSLTLSRLARVCQDLREHVDAYRNTCMYGRRLAFDGLRHVRTLLIARHTKCAGKGGLDDLAKAVDRYVPRLCVSYHDLPPITGPEEPRPRHAASRRERQIAAAVRDRSVDAIVQSWDLANIAAFLIPFATQLGPEWPEASAAICWALWALDLRTLRRVVFAPEPREALAECAKTPEQTTITHLVEAICALRDMPAPEEEKSGQKARETKEYTRAKEAGLLTITQAAVKYTDSYTARVGIRDPVCLEFALAGGALAINHSLKVVPTSGRFHYIRAIHTSFQADRLRAIGNVPKMLLKVMGLLGPATKVSALEDFQCRLSAPDPAEVGAALAAILAMGPPGAGGPPAALMVGPGGAGIPVPPAFLAALLMGPVMGGGGGDTSDDESADEPPPLEDD